MSYEFTKSYQECSINLTFSFLSSLQFNGISAKDVMQRKLFQKCTHLFYYSVLSLGGKVNTRRIHFSHKKSMKYSCRRKLLCELSKLSNLMLLTSSDTKDNTDAFILVYKFRLKRTGFNLYAEYTRPQLNFLALHPCERMRYDLVTSELF